MLRWKGFFVFSIVLCVSLLIFGCSIFEDDDEPKIEPLPEPEAPESVSTYKFSGKIVDEAGDPIPGVKIIFMGNGSSGTIFSDLNGNFTVMDVAVGSYTLTALKTGYTYGEIKFDMTENGASVPEISLGNLREIEGRDEEVTTAADIKSNGAEVVSIVDEEVSVGGGVTEMKQKEAKASIPQDTVITIAGETVTEEIVLAVAPLEIDEIPPPEKEDEMPFGAAVFEPQDAVFSKSVEVSVPLEIQLPAGIEIPLKKYKDGEWVEIGMATIDESGFGADADVNEFGQFAIQPKVTLEVEADPEPEEEIVQSIDVPAEQETFQAEVTDTVEFPDGLPEGVTVEYAVSLIEKMKGAKIGESKTITVDSPLVNTLAKRAQTEEEWIITWTVEKKIITVTETITLTIDLGGGQTIDITITYEYTQVTWVPKILDKTVKWWIDVTVNGASGVTVTLGGDASDSALLNEGESHRFLGDTGGNYTLTPSKPGFDFTPGVISITKLGSDVQKTFTAKKKLEKLTISGTVTGAAGVTVSLSGDETDVSTVKQSGGSYEFSVDANKSYTVTPSLEGYTFEPESASFTDLSSDATQNFVATKITATISGTVSGANGVKVTLDGDASGTFDVINAGDSYTFTVDIGGDYTISATKGSYIVIPESKTIANVTEDIVQDFDAKKKQKRVYISGSVEGANNVTVELSDDTSKSVTLDDGESYSWEVKAGGTYTVTASASGVEFETSSETYEDLQTDAGINFVAIQYVTISGTLTLEDETSISNVLVTLGGDASESKTVSGSYSFTVKANGSYTVTPTKDNYTFLPAVSEAYITSDTTMNFQGTKWVTISGTVSGADGVLVAIEDGESVTVDSGGSYEFKVPAGYGYVVTATKAGVVFFEPSKTFTNLNSNVTWNIAKKHDQGGS